MVSEDDARRVQPLRKLIKSAAVKVNKAVDRHSTFIALPLSYSCLTDQSVHIDKSHYWKPQTTQMSANTAALPPAPVKRDSYGNDNGRHDELQEKAEK